MILSRGPDMRSEHQIEGHQIRQIIPGHRRFPVVFSNGVLHVIFAESVKLEKNDHKTMLNLVAKNYFGFDILHLQFSNIPWVS